MHTFLIKDEKYFSPASQLLWDTFPATHFIEKAFVVLDSLRGLVKLNTDFGCPKNLIEVFCKLFTSSAEEKLDIVW